MKYQSLTQGVRNVGYTEASAGIPYADWVGAMLQSMGGTGGAGGGQWRDAACKTCLDPVPCQP